MESIKAWILTIAAVAMSGNIAHMLAPSETLAKYIRFIAALTLIVVIAAPIVNFNGNVKLPDIDTNYQKEYYGIFTSVDNQIKDEFIKNMKSAIKKGMTDELKTIPADIVLDITGNGEQLNVKSATVYLKKSDASKAQSATFYLNNVLRLKAEVKILKE